MNIFGPWARRKAEPGPTITGATFGPSAQARLASLVISPHIISAMDRELADAQRQAFAAQEGELETRRLLDNLVRAIGMASISTTLSPETIRAARDLGRGLYVKAPHVDHPPTQRALTEARAHLGRII